MNVNEMTKEIRRAISTKEGQMSDEEVLSYIEHYVLERGSLSICDIGESHKMIMKIFYSIRKDLDILQPYADDETVSEIMVNGKDDIFVERNGIIEKTGESFEKTEDLEEVIRRAAAGIHREINELNPIVDARLHDGSRINAVYKNIALNGPILTIRKFPQKAFTMKDLIGFGTLTQECADYLKMLVETGYNCFISGGTSSGKTTFLNVLTDYIPKEERIIVIEDSAELQIKGIKNIVRMECKNANVQGKGQITMQHLIKTSLRMRPDRIIVGEVRGKEVMDMIQAMNTGHDGSLSTGHGNSIEGMLRRLESMFLQAADFPIDAIRSQIAEGIDIIIHLSRLTDKERKVLEISEIKGVEKDRIIMNSIYKYIPGKGLERTGNRLVNREKLKLKGYKNQ
ncbi:MAG: ATPase, T2SS/T4P/T4SS family [Eubacteriales bacterium]|jgi:pilus assembly protein CpaF|nr:ATPase, T2SS/T4P/T4SS family [Eubacteriales bacterium]NLF47230.1 CpaF family protein [Clostridiales bacterium]